MNDPVSLILLAAAVIGALGIIWQQLVRRGRGAVKEVRSDARKIRDTLVGRDAVVDSITGKEISPALPALGQRMDTVERAVAVLADQHRTLEDHEDRIAANRRDIDALQAAQVERVITRAESAQAWSAMEAAINSQPDDSPEVEG